MAELTRADLGIWLINLDRDRARLAAMHQQLDAMGLAYTRFAAIDGTAQADTLMPRVDAAAYARNMGQAVSAGHMGCYASHVAVWEQVAQAPQPVALILEDDVVFHDDFLESLDAALAGAAAWDTLRFNCIRAKWPVCQGHLGQYRLNAYIGPFTGNATYLVKRDVAGRLAAGFWPQTRAHDHEMNRFFHHDFRQFGLEPFSSHVDDGGVSTITGTGFDRVRKFPWYRRLPHYRLKAANYFRRAWWLARNGFLFSRSISRSSNSRYADQTESSRK